MIGLVGLPAQAALLFHWPSGDAGWQILWTALKVNAIAFKPDAVRSGCLSGHVSILKNQITILVSSTFISVIEVQTTHGQTNLDPSGLIPTRKVHLFVF